MTHKWFNVWPTRINTIKIHWCDGPSGNNGILQLVHLLNNIYSWRLSHEFKVQKLALRCFAIRKGHDYIIKFDPKIGKFAYLLIFLLLGNWYNKHDLVLVFWGIITTGQMLSNCWRNWFYILEILALKCQSMIAPLTASQCMWKSHALYDVNIIHAVV